MCVCVSRAIFEWAMSQRDLAKGSRHISICTIQNAMNEQRQVTELNANFKFILMNSNA